MVKCFIKMFLLLLLSQPAARGPSPFGLVTSNEMYMYFSIVQLFIKMFKKYIFCSISNWANMPSLPCLYHQLCTTTEVSGKEYFQNWFCIFRTLYRSTTDESQCKRYINLSDAMSGSRPWPSYYKKLRCRWHTADARGVAYKYTVICLG